MPNYDWDTWEQRMAGHSDAIDAVIAMERAGLLTAQAARVITAITALRPHGVVDCGWDTSTQTGWVEYRRLLYTPADFSALIAEETGGADTTDEVAETKAPDGSASLPAAPSGQFARLVTAGKLAAALMALAGAILVTLLGVAWLVTQAMGQLVMLLASGFAAFLTALLSW